LDRIFQDLVVVTNELNMELEVLHGGELRIQRIAGTLAIAGGLGSLDFFLILVRFSHPPTFAVTSSHKPPRL
jgi:hypothetical protein